MVHPARTRLALATVAVGLLALSTACSESSGGGDELTSGGSVAVQTLPAVVTTAVAPTSAPATVQPPATAAQVTTASATTVPRSTTAPSSVASTVASTTPPTPPTPTTLGPSTSSPVTQAPEGGACSLDAVVSQSGAPTDGVTPADLACAGGWASFVGRPDDQFGDGYFAVVRWDGARWQLANLGTADVCAAADVPADLWNALRCI